MEEKDEIKEEKNEEFFKINNTINKLNKIYENFLKDYKKSNKNVDMIVNLLNNNGIFHPDLKEITKKYFDNNKNNNDEENSKNSNEMSSNPNETQNREEKKFINDEENNKITNEISSIPKENQNKEENKNNNDEENIINFKEENFYYFLLFIKKFYINLYFNIIHKLNNNFNIFLILV